MDPVARRHQVRAGAAAQRVRVSGARRAQYTRGIARRGESSLARFSQVRSVPHSGERRMVHAVLAVSALQQPVDSAYTAKIRELTTEPRFNTELTDHLPADSKVPTPLKVLGYVPGTVGRLSYVADITRYFRALDEASPRVKVFDLGTSDEGRPMIIAAIADSATIARLESYRAITAALADPRALSPDSALRLIAAGKPLYWLSGSIHSPETGSPEMLMELAYRLAVEETPFIRQIRKNSIIMITPVIEVDGRDMMVDLYRWRKENPAKAAPPLVYWGKYVAHDNNRDS